MSLIEQKNTELSQEEAIRKFIQAFSKLKLIDLSAGKNESVISTFSKDDLKRYLKDISKPNNQKKLREISRALYISSPHYRSLINYYSTLYNFDYVVEGYDADPYTINKEEYRKAYFKSVDSIEKMNIKHESLKIRVNAYLDGVFYGFARSSKNGFYIQHFDPNHCKISYINYETGLFGYSFDFSFFKGNEKLLDNYPEEFAEIYKSLEDSNSRNYWVKIESPNAICIKTSPWNYPIPPLVGLFEGILDIADFKALNKGSEEIGNYKILFQQIPMKDGRDAEIDHFLISEEFVQIFHENIAENLPPQVGLITTPMKVEPLNFEKDTVDKNKVGEATSQYWNEAGVSELLFGNNDTSAALKYSVTADETTLITLVEDFQRWINEYIKATYRGAYKFRVRILHTTKFNLGDYFNIRLKAAQFGLPVKNELVAILGMQPSSMYINTFLENEVLGLIDKLIPLNSSHTQSDSEGGAPEKREEDLSDDGLKTRENDANGK